MAVKNSIFHTVGGRGSAIGYGRELIFSTIGSYFGPKPFHLGVISPHIHTILTAFVLPRSIIQGPFGPIQPISSIHGDKLEVSKSQKMFWPVVGSN